MVRAKFNYPDLDVPDSPLMSPIPLTSIGGISGSAIAEKIFNDPDSWEENDADDADVPDAPAHDPLAWLVDEIEKFRANSPDLHGVFDAAVYRKRKLGLTTPPPGRRVLGTGLKGIGRTTIRPISITSFFEPANDEDIQAQLSKILHSGGIPHHVHPLSSALSPPSTAGSSNIYTPLHINTASTVASSTSGDPSPIVIHSASTTLSFLEWYGIYPDSDLNHRSVTQQRQKSTKPKSSALVVPSPRRHMRSSSLVSPPPKRDSFSGLLAVKRVSSVPLPPGLEPPTLPPPRLPRPQPFSPTSTQLPKPSNPPLYRASPPPYTRTPSPAGSRPNSRSSSSSRSQSRTDTPSQGMSTSDPNGAARRRRLPSIPSDPGADLVSAPQIHNPTLAPSRLASPPRSLTAPSSVVTGTLTSQALTTQLQLSASRTLSAARSMPLVGPAGPRTRANQSLMRRQDSTITRSTSLTHRPPVLRL